MGRHDGIFGDDDDDGVFGPESDDVGASQNATWQRLESSREVPRTRDPVYLKHWDRDLEVGEPTDLSLLDRNINDQRRTTYRSRSPMSVVLEPVAKEIRRDQARLERQMLARKASDAVREVLEVDRIEKMLKAHDYTSVEVSRRIPQTWKGQPVSGFLATYEHPIDVDFIQKTHGGGVYDVVVRGYTPRNPGQKNAFLDSMRVKISGEPLLLTDTEEGEDEKKMAFSRKISRVEFLEGLHRFLSTTELKIHENARNPFFTKQQLLRAFIEIDNTISSMALEKYWDEYIGYNQTYNLGWNSHYGRDVAVCNQGKVDTSPWTFESAIKDAKRRDEEEESGVTTEPEPQLIAAPTDPVLLQAIEGVASELRMTREQMPTGPDQWQLEQQRMSEEQRAKELLQAIENVGGNLNQLNNQMGDIYHGLDALVQYQLEAQRLKEVAALEAATKPERMTMAERMKNAALETGTGVVSAFQEGLKISGSQRLSKKVVTVFHNKLGQHIPGAETAVGQKVEALMIPALVHFMANAFSDKVPKADLVQRTCLRAVTGEAKDSGDELLDLFLPVFGEIASMESMTDLASQFAQEDTPEMPEKSTATSLSESIAGQLDGLQDGDKVEITVKRASDQKVAAEADE